MSPGPLQGAGKVSVVLCSITLSSAGPHWGMAGVEMRDQLESFSAKPSPVVQTMPSV